MYRTVWIKKKPWSKSYIDRSRATRAATKKNFPNELYSVLSIACSRKTLGNVREREKLNFIFVDQIEQHHKEENQRSSVEKGSFNNFDIFPLRKQKRTFSEAKIYDSRF